MRRAWAASHPWLACYFPKVQGARLLGSPQPRTRRKTETTASTRPAQGSRKQKMRIVRTFDVFHRLDAPFLSGSRQEGRSGRGRAPAPGAIDAAGRTTKGIRPENDKMRRAWAAS